MFKKQESQCDFKQLKRKMERVEASMTGQDYVTMNVVNDGKVFRLCSKPSLVAQIKNTQNNGSTIASILLKGN